MPIVFISAGAAIDVQVLLTPQLLVIAIVCLIVAMIIKGIVTAIILRKEHYDTYQIKYAVTGFSVKGGALINYSIVLTPIYVSNSLEHVTIFMTYLGTIIYVTSILIQGTVLSHKGPHWLRESHELEK